MNTRPTPDRLRESLFNVLQPMLAGATFLDAYAGTGAIGIEALSRGCDRAIFIERSQAAVNIIRENLQALKAFSRAEILQGRVLQYLTHRSTDIVFLDPPYDLLNEYRDSMAILGEKPPKLVIAQHSKRLELEPKYGALQRTRVLKQGDNALSFYKTQHSVQTSE